MKSALLLFRSNLKALVILACGLISSGAFSQGRQLTLPQIDREYQDYRKGADARIQDYMKKNPEALVTFKKNHVVYLMVDVSESGMPTYIKTDNSQVAFSLNVPQLRTGGSLGINILGTGMKIGTWDGGKVRNDHVELVGRVTFGDNAGAFDDHATHTSGTMLATGINLLAKGMAPAATLLAYDFSNDVSEMTVQAKPDQTSLILSNHSYGTVCGWQFDGSAWSWHGDASISSTEDYKFGYYDTQAQQWDGIAFSAPYYLIVKAAGNDRSDTGDGSKPPDGNNGFDCIPTYGTAKNILTVGAVNKLFSPYAQPSDVQMTSFSSWGPTDDGRIKPDLVAPGLNVLSSTAGSTTEYKSFDGTSMATPAVTGTLALLQQLYKSLNSGNYMRSATLKALAIHTARETGANPGPDYSYGWGLLDAEGAAKIIINKDNQNIFMKETTLVSGQTFEMDLGTPKPGTKIKATLVWTDPAGTVSTPSLDNTAKKLVNDLDLRLVEAGGTPKMPWILNPATPSAAATTGDNTRDNVEKIEFSPTLSTNYKIQVSNKGTLVQGPQAFSLILEYSSVVDPLVSYYWIGDGGNWEDGSHWSLTSGGAPVGSPPTSANRVVVDDKSFTNGAQTITLNANTSIASLRWFGSLPAAFSLNGNTLSIAEGMTFLNGTVTMPTVGTINFTSAATSPNAVDLAGSIWTKLILNFSGTSSWNITGSAWLDKITVSQGTVSFNNANMRVNQLTTTGTPTVAFNTSSIQALQNLAVDLTGATIQSDNTSAFTIVPAVTNTINVGSGNFQGIIVLQSGTVTVNGTGQVRSIQGNGTAQLNGHLLISNLNLSGGSQLILQQGSTQTFTDKFVFSTSSNSRVAVKSSLAGSVATLAFNNYYKICVDFIDVSDVKVDITNSTLANAGQGSTLTTNSLNWVKADCSTLIFPDFNTSNSCIQSSTYFTDASTGTITSRSWNFGDPSSGQNTSTLNSPLHYYATAGPYTATLTVNGASGSRSISKQVTLTANDLPNNTVQLNNGNLISTVIAQSYQWLQDGQIIAGSTSRSYGFGTTPAEYSVLIFSTTCNKRSSPYLVTAAEDVSAKVLKEVKIYPNPTSDFLQIETGSPVLGTSILDAMGREIRLEAEPMDAGRYRLNVSTIPNGLYILKVATREKTDLQKLIIRK